VKRPVLDIRGLVVHRDGTLILDRLDWRVQRGEQPGVSSLVPKSRGDTLPP
jgi:ABC-type molybdenum transport system ATPase subunit/photorepair protein PhrA